MIDFLQMLFFGNTVQQYLIAIVVFAGVIAAAYTFRIYILRHVHKLADLTSSKIDNALIAIVEKSIMPIAYYFSLYLAISTLTLTPAASKVLTKVTIVFITVIFVKTIISAVNYGVIQYLYRSSDSSAKEKQLKGIFGLLNFLIWVLALVFLLDNLGVRISAVVAGLGIGGIAVALAAQAVLGDLFSYFVIFFDKPFEIGDFIVVDDKMGVVEYIGVKTTRIRALGGEVLVLSNTDLTNSRLHNFKKMESRRVVFTLNVTYQTASEQLRRIPHMVKEIVVAQPGAMYDRGHFSAYGDYSLKFEFVYFVTSADYVAYMDIQQSINIRIYEAFQQEGIHFAYPTNMVILQPAVQQPSS